MPQSIDFSGVAEAIEEAAKEIIKLNFKFNDIFENVVL